MRSTRADALTRRRRRPALKARAYLAAWRAVRRLPAEAAYPLFGLVADLAWRRRGPGVTRLEANLHAAGVQGVRTVSRAGMRAYLRYWCEVFRLPGWSREQVLASVRTEGDAGVRQALAQGHGVVMCLAHQGNWDLAGAWAGYDLAPVTTVAERLEPVAVFEAFLQFRRGLGMTVLGLGDPGLLGELSAAVRAGHVVPLLADRDLTGSGIEVDFLGGRARFAAGPAMLADLTGADLVPVTIFHERVRVEAQGWPESGHRTVIRFHPRVTGTGVGRAERVRSATQACADSLAAGIRERPGDWHMLQRVFVDDADRPPR